MFFYFKLSHNAYIFQLHQQYNIIIEKFVTSIIEIINSLTQYLIFH